MEQTPMPNESIAPAETASRPKWRSWVTSALLGALLGAWLVKKPTHHSLASGVWTAPMTLHFYFWMALSVYWVWAGRNKSPARSAESSLSRSWHLLLVNGGLVVSFWPFDGWPSPTTSLFQFPRVLPALPWLPPLGVAVAAGGLLLAIWARRSLGRHWSGEVTVKLDHELIRGGPYRWVRHPIYSGAIAMYLGTTITSGRLQGPLSLLLIATAYTRKIRQEERVLNAEFGAAYDDYRRESWAVIPWVI
jgi:protein-S-isoprenylcysteine O-methyltransferase Ste14